jgi:EAL domain-containing protein (putative c-di-GMP-specific phosphodiesterase class I)
MVAERSRPLHVVISDLSMPGMDGMEFLRRLSEARLDVGVLITSAQDDAVLRSVEMMANEYGLSVLGVLPKPVSVHALREKLTSYSAHTARRTRSPVSSVTADQILRGLNAGEFRLVYQPKVDLASLAQRGAEALVRWRHPTLGELTPGRFIPAVERFGIMNSLTLALVERAAIEMRQWASTGLEIPVSLNVSLPCLADTRFAGRVIAVLSRHDVPPSLLTVEVTETVAMTDVGHCLESLSRLRMHRVGLAIDDFGTGHSSLQQLSRVPCTELKIDRSFVTGAAGKPHLRAIVESSVGMAKRLGLTCVAEGVESSGDRDFLLELGCEVGQGYLIARPMEAARFAEWVRSASVRQSLTLRPQDWGRGLSRVR